MQAAPLVDLPAMAAPPILARPLETMRAPRPKPQSEAEPDTRLGLSLARWTELRRSAEARQAADDDDEDALLLMG